jgi:hypothetical protein
MSTYEREYFLNVAQRITACGFTVYEAEQGTYGFYTDNAQTRVVSFGIRLGVLEFSGNYEPNKENGSGWRMEEILLNEKALREALYSGVPHWIRFTASKPVFMTVQSYLDHYQSSSRYKLVEPAKSRSRGRSTGPISSRGRKL